MTARNIVPSNVIQPEFMLRNNYEVKGLPYLSDKKYSLADDVKYVTWETTDSGLTIINLGIYAKVHNSAALVAARTTKMLTVRQFDVYGEDVSGHVFTFRDLLFKNTRHSLDSSAAEPSIVRFTFTTNTPVTECERAGSV